MKKNARDKTSINILQQLNIRGYTYYRWIESKFLQINSVSEIQSYRNIFHD